MQSAKPGTFLAAGSLALVALAASLIVVHVQAAPQQPLLRTAALEVTKQEIEALEQDVDRQLFIESKIKAKVQEPGQLVEATAQEPGQFIEAKAQEPGQLVEISSLGNMLVSDTDNNKRRSSVDEHRSAIRQAKRTERSRVKTTTKTGAAFAELHEVVSSVPERLSSGSGSTIGIGIAALFILPCVGYVIYVMCTPDPGESEQQDSGEGKPKGKGKGKGKGQAKAKAAAKKAEGEEQTEEDKEAPMVEKRSLAKGKAKPKPKGKAAAKGAGKADGEDKEGIRAMPSGGKMTPASSAASGSLVLEEDQRVYLVIKKIAAENVPAVDLFGGAADPFVDFRIVSKDPQKMNVDQLYKPLEKEFQQVTERKDDDRDPEFQDVLEFHAHNASNLYLHYILWDYNITSNTAIAQGTQTISEAVKGTPADGKPTKHELQLKTFKEKWLSPTLRFSLHCYPLLRFKIEPVEASKFPKMESWIGGQSTSLEFRCLRDAKVAKDPYEADLQRPKCFWSAQTKVMETKINEKTAAPEFKQSFKPDLPGNGDMKLQVILRHHSPEAVLGHCIIDMQDILERVKPGGEPESFEVQFKKLPGPDPPAASISKSTCKLQISYDTLSKKKRDD